MNKKLFILRILITALVCLTATPLFAQITTSSTDMPEEDDPFRELREAIVDTGLPRDSAPALVRPNYMSVSDASLSMDDAEVVFLAPFFPDGVMRIYPQRIMVWHEVINEFFDESNEKPVAITYCPITGSLAAYNLHAGRRPISLGVSGELLNNNSVLYDHYSGSLWPQITGQAIDGPFKGKTLPRLPVLWTTWGFARKAYPEGLVLSRNTGFKRNYGRDPYGSYLNSDSYYDNLQVYYPLLHADKRLKPKERMVCIEFDNLAIAVNKAEAKKLGVVNFTMGITPLVAMYDPALDTVRIFNRQLPGQKESLTFSWTGSYMVDDQTRTEWNNLGRGSLGKLRDVQLTPVNTVESMWFAWAAFYPRTRIVPGKEF
ncbi:MAG: DUF3179 domain-containing protein [Desulfovibrionaceae bacterium]|nr:DUF3179 domain-containing protein [Desulfovibrionaceae bacterium]